MRTRSAKYGIMILTRFGFSLSYNLQDVNTNLRDDTKGSRMTSLQTPASSDNLTLHPEPIRNPLRRGVRIRVQLLDQGGICLGGDVVEEDRFEICGGA